VIGEGGVGAMELVDIGMKLRSMYLALQLSFQDASNKVEEVSLTPEFKKMYNDSVKLGSKVFEDLTEGLKLVKADQILVKMTRKAS